MQDKGFAIEDMIGGLFKEIFDGNLNNVRYTPPGNIRQEEDGIVLELDMPGVEKDQIEIDISNDHILISTKREQKHDFIKVESYFGDIKRTFKLTPIIDQDKIEADYKNGVLSIKFNYIKEAENKSTTRINVQ